MIAQVPRCRSCGVLILWATTEAGKRMPVDAEPSLMGNLWLDYAGDGSDPVARPVTLENAHLEETETRFVSHFATCPEAGEWRR